MFAALALAGYVGWRRGTLLMLLAIAALGAGYLGAALLFRPVGRALARTFPIPPLIALPLGGMVVMFAITAAIRMATRAAQRRRALARRQGATPSRADSAGGAAIGVLQAAGYAIVLAWFAMSLRSIAHAGPDISGTFTGRASSAVMQRASYAVTSRLTGDPFVATMLSVVATHPSEGVSAVNTLLRNRRVQDLFTNPSLRTALAGRDVATLAGSPAVRALAADTGFLAAAAQLGLAPGQPGGDALAQALATRVAPLARSVQALSADGEVRRVLEDREFKRLVEQGDFAALAASPQFNRLAGRILAGLRQAGAAH